MKKKKSTFELHLLKETVFGEFNEIPVEEIEKVRRLN
ncbi:hypothetical protein Bhyg_10029, partial [Pseudolycoriella hygida]